MNGWRQSNTLCHTYLFGDEGRGCEKQFVASVHSVESPAQNYMIVIVSGRGVNSRLFHGGLVALKKQKMICTISISL